MDTQEIIWRNFRMRLPAAWEMLQFSSDLTNGRCAFADRYQFRLECSWETVPGTPDFGRMLRDYRAALELQETVREVTEVRTAGWHGLAAKSENGSSSRFGRHFPGEQCLVELVFLWPGPRDAQMERAVIESFGEEPTAADGRRRWRAFGMEARPTAGLELRSCIAQPGRGKFLFDRGRRSLRREEFERLGMVSQWLKRPVGEWLRLRAPGDVTVDGEDRLSVAGHDVHCCGGSRAATGLARLWGRRSRVESFAWTCPADGRLYGLTLSGAETTLAPASVFTRLVCCEGARGKAI